MKEVLEKIISHIDESVRDLSGDEYTKLLIDLINDLETRLNAQLDNGKNNHIDDESDENIPDE